MGEKWHFFWWFWFDIDRFALKSIVAIYITWIWAINIFFSDGFKCLQTRIKMWCVCKFQNQKWMVPPPWQSFCHKHTQSKRPSYSFFFLSLYILGWYKCEKREINVHFQITFEAIWFCAIFVMNLVVFVTVGVICMNKWLLAVANKNSSLLSSDVINFVYQIEIIHARNVLYFGWIFYSLYMSNFWIFLFLFFIFCCLWN